jgi:hypothetical protein
MSRRPRHASATVIRSPQSPLPADLDLSVVGVGARSVHALASCRPSVTIPSNLTLSSSSPMRGQVAATAAMVEAVAVGASRRPSIWEVLEVPDTLQARLIALDYVESVRLTVDDQCDDVFVLQLEDAPPPPSLAQAADLGISEGPFSQAVWSDDESYCRSVEGNSVPRPGPVAVADWDSWMFAFARPLHSLRHYPPGGLHFRAGATPLHVCAAWRLIDSVRLLLNYGAEVDAMDASGANALMLACQARYWQPPGSRINSALSITSTAPLTPRVSNCPNQAWFAAMSQFGAIV